MCSMGVNTQSWEERKKNKKVDNVKILAIPSWRGSKNTVMYFKTVELNECDVSYETRVVEVVQDWDTL